MSFMAALGVLVFARIYLQSNNKIEMPISPLYYHPFNTSNREKMSFTFDLNSLTSNQLLELISTATAVYAVKMNSSAPVAVATPVPVATPVATPVKRKKAAKTAVAPVAAAPVAPAVAPVAVPVAPEQPELLIPPTPKKKAAVGTMAWIAFVKHVKQTMPQRFEGAKLAKESLAIAQAIKTEDKEAYDAFVANYKATA